MEKNRKISPTEELGALYAIIKEKDAEIDRLTTENKGLKEYSESRDESIKVYREEIKELKEVTNYYIAQLHKAEERLKGIEEMGEEYKDPESITTNLLDAAAKMWQAIQKAREVK